MDQDPLIDPLIASGREPKAVPSGSPPVAAGRATFFCLLFILWNVLFIRSISAAIDRDHSPRASPSRFAMRQHYDAAFRFQTAGDLRKAGEQYKLFLAEALHELGNGRAEIREYALALPLYEDAVGLTSPDLTLYLDYAGAALDAGDPRKARAFAQRALDLHAKEMQPSQAASAHIIIGQALRKMADYAGAAEHFKAAATIEPSSENMYRLGGAYLALPDVPSADKVFDEILARYGNTAVTRKKLGIAFGDAGYPDQAIEEFRKAIAKDDKLPGLHYALGASYLNKSGDAGFPLAEPELRKELLIQPNDPLVYPQLGRITMSEHKYREAEMDLQLATVLTPQNPNNFFLLGELYVEMHRTADAEAALRMAIEKTPDPSLTHYDIQRAHYRLGHLLVEDGKAEEGKKELDLAEDMLLRSRLQDESKMAGKPENPIALSAARAATAKDVAAEKAFEKQMAPLIAGCFDNLGGIAANDKQYAEAADDYARASQWAPELKGVDENWGRAAFAAKQYTPAVAPLGRAFHAHPDDVQLRVMLGVSQYETHDYHGAVATLQPVDKYLRMFPVPAFDYAEAMVRAGKVDEGSRWLQDLLQADPENPNLHRAMGDAYAGGGDYARAEEELRTAVKLDPRDSEAKYLLSQNSIARGQKAEAEALLAAMVTAGSQRADVYCSLGKLQLERGDGKAAVGNLELAAKAAPTSVDVHQALAEAYGKDGRTAELEREKQILKALETGTAGLRSPDSGAAGLPDPAKQD